MHTKVFAEGYTPWFYLFEKKPIFPGEPTPRGWKAVGNPKPLMLFDTFVVVGALFPGIVSTGYIVASTVYVVASTVYIVGHSFQVSKKLV
jgi:hypothetical protein